MGKVFFQPSDEEVSGPGPELLMSENQEKAKKAVDAKNITEEDQYTALLQSTPSYINDHVFYGDKVIVRLIKKEKIAKSGLFIPDTKLVPSASELKKKLEFTDEDEQYLYRGVVVATGLDCKYTLPVGTVIELNRAMQPVQLASYSLKFKNFAGDTEHENFYSIPSVQITSSWKTSEAYLDFLKNHRKITD